MNRTDIEKEIYSIASAVFRQEISTGHPALRDDIEKWDSLNHMELIFACEAEYDISFSEDEINEVKSLPQLVEMTVRKNAP